MKKGIGYGVLIRLKLPLDNRDPVSLSSCCRWYTGTLDVPDMRGEEAGVFIHWFPSLIDWGPSSGHWKSGISWLPCAFISRYVISLYILYFQLQEWCWVDGWWPRTGNDEGWVRSGVTLGLEERFAQLVSNDFFAVSGTCGWFGNDDDARGFT